VSELLTYNSD